MTPNDTVRLVNMMLDDSIDWYFPDILKAINEAQIKVVRKYYAIQHERALRTLYRRDVQLKNYDVIYERDPVTNQRTVPANVMYPRAARLYNESNVLHNFYAANYVDYSYYVVNDFRRYEAFDGDANKRFPKTCYYTLHKESFNDSLITKILFNGRIPDSRCEFWYIKKPAVFNSDKVNPFLDQPLEMPEEFHPEIAALAAEILNDIDVNEMERGDIVYQNQKLNLQTPFGG